MRTALLFVALALLYIGAARVEWRDGGLRRATPQAVSGDEPHYLMIANSLLFDRDLRLEDDYRRVRAGGAQAGLAFRGAELDHHTIVLDTRTGAHALWFDLYDWTAHVACEPPCVPFRKLRAGLDPAPGVIERPAHPPAYSALLALAVSPFRPGPAEVESLASFAVALICAGALTALWLAARRAGYSEREAMAAVVLSGVLSPFLAYGKSFFSEPAAALFLCLALWAFAAQRPAWCALAIGAAAAIKPPFALVGLAWLFLLPRRFAVVLVACGVFLAAFNVWLARTPFVSGTQGFLPAHGLEAVGVLLTSDRHGLFNYGAWTLLLLILGRRALSQPLVRAMALGLLPVFAMLVAGDFGGGGACVGPRYFVPFLPWLALGAVAGLREARPWHRNAAAALVGVSLIVSAGAVLRYRDLFDQPISRMFHR